MPACKIFVFDAYGTLFDVNSAVARCREEVGRRRIAFQSYGAANSSNHTWVRSLMNSYRDFAAITADALGFAAQKIGGLPPELQAKLLDDYQDLDVFADVRPALSGLKQLGLQTAILSNGTLAMLERACRVSSITPLIDAILSADQIGVFKTDRRVYDMVISHFNCAPNEVSIPSLPTAGMSRPPPTMDFAALRSTEPINPMNIATIDHVPGQMTQSPSRAAPL